MPKRVSSRDWLLGTAGVDDDGRAGYTLNVSMSGTGGTGASALAVQGGTAGGTAKASNPILTGGVYNTTAPTYTNGQQTETQSDSRGNTKVSVVSLDGTVGLPFTTAGLSVLGTPTSTAANSITPVTSLGGTGLVVKASAGNHYSASMTAGATAGFFIAYNATAVPAAGAALTANLIINAAPVTANGYANLGGNPIPDRHSTGVVLLFSTTLATYTAPANPAVFMRGSAA